MKTIKLLLNIEPYSVNKYFYGNRSIKRRQTVEWELRIIDCLKSDKTQKELEEFRNLFSFEKNSLKIDMIFHYPKEILYTKKNHLSSRAFDISNVEKPLIDVIFLAKYSNDKVKNLEIDDKYIVEMSSKKTHSKDLNHYIEIIIELLDLPDL
jgi:hypothetical protein